MAHSAGCTELLSHILSLRHPSLVLCHSFCPVFFSLIPLCLLHNCLWAHGIDSSVAENMEAVCGHILSSSCAYTGFFSVFTLCLPGSEEKCLVPIKATGVFVMSSYPNISSRLLLHLHILAFITFPSCLSCSHLKHGQTKNKTKELNSSLCHIFFLDPVFFSWHITMYLEGIVCSSCFPMLIFHSLDCWS